MSAVKLRIDISDGRASLVKGWTKRALSGIRVSSEAQRYRRRRMIVVAARYFGHGKGVEEISEVMGISHQRVSAILGDAVKLLESQGLILRREDATCPVSGQRRVRRK